MYIFLIIVALILLGAGLACAILFLGDSAFTIILTSSLLFGLLGMLLSIAIIFVYDV